MEGVEDYGSVGAILQRCGNQLFRGVLMARNHGADMRKLIARSSETITLDIAAIFYDESEVWCAPKHMLQHGTSASAEDFFIEGRNRIEIRRGNRHSRSQR